MSENKTFFSSILFKIIALAIFLGVSGYLIYIKTKEYNQEVEETNKPSNKEYFSSSKSGLSIDDDIIKQENQNLGKSKNKNTPNKKKKPFIFSSKNMDPALIESSDKSNPTIKPNQEIFLPTTKSAPTDMFKERKTKDKKTFKKKKYFESSKLAPVDIFEKNKKEPKKKEKENEQKKEKNKK